ncbi:MAG: hypothetical protein E6686_00860 [Lachnospiraceae bacterium]|nr:hypothetical protein [Lachnospiraceae bacterium]
MEGKNYWRLRRFSLFYKYYAFVDTEEYLGDQLFIQQKVEVSFGKEFGKKGNDYLIIFCKVRKKDEKNFLKALDELEKKMLLMGHHDYPAFCENLKLQMPGEKV